MIVLLHPRIALALLAVLTGSAGVANLLDGHWVGLAGLVAAASAVVVSVRPMCRVVAGAGAVFTSAAGVWALDAAAHGTWLLAGLWAVNGYLALWTFGHLFVPWTVTRERV